MEWQRIEAPDKGHTWNGTVVCLAVPTEADLYFFLLEVKDLDPIPFFEPDIDDELSAFAVLLNEEQAKLFAHFPLAGSHAVNFPEKGGE